MTHKCCDNFPMFHALLLAFSAIPVVEVLRYCVLTEAAADDIPILGADRDLGGGTLGGLLTNATTFGLYTNL